MPSWHLNTYKIINLITSITLNGNTKTLTYPCEGIFFFWKHKLGVDWTEEYKTVKKKKKEYPFMLRLMPAMYKIYITGKKQ